MVGQATIQTGRAGWQPEEMMQLRNAVRSAAQCGEPLRSVFENVGKALGRRPNSIRNFYYAQLKSGNDVEMPHALPFQTFTDDEVRNLLCTVLEARAAGISVRACVMRMAEGDKTMMLRYQNKYRSVLKTRPDLIEEIISAMKAKGMTTFDPYQRKHQESDAQAKAAVDPPLIQQMYEGIQQLLSRSDVHDPLVERDRMQVRQDLLRIELDNIQIRIERIQQQCQPLIMECKEFLGLPLDGRKQELVNFCEALSERISALENAQ